MPTNTLTPEPSFDGQSLLETADQWRIAGRRAIRASEWETADAALTAAESAYDSALRVVPEGSPEKTRLAEGRALCTVLRSDIELRRWHLGEAEKRLDEAYKAFKAVDDAVIGAELWRLTARLAERQGRWRSAKAAWKRVVKIVESEDEVALGDALVRVAELEIIEDNPEGADKVLARVEYLARDLEDDLLRARVLVVRAADFESRREFAAAWDAWHDAQMSTSVAPVEFAGLLKIRMAGTAVWIKPTQAFRLVETGYEALVSARHPDALGLAYHQLSVLALVVQDVKASALAAIGARICRGGYDDTTRPMLVLALRQAGFEATAEVVETGEDPAQVEERLRSALSAACEDVGLKWEQLGHEEAMLILCGSIRRQRPQSVQIRVEGEDVWRLDRAMLVRHRATLTWDAPVDTLSGSPALLPRVAPTPPPVPRALAPRPSGFASESSLASGTPMEVGPRPVPPLPGMRAQQSVNLLLGALSMILFAAGLLALGMLVLIRFMQ